MSDPEHDTHAALISRLRDSIDRLRLDIEPRADPALEEITRALEVLADLSTHVHEHALEGRRRLDSGENPG